MNPVVEKFRESRVELCRKAIEGAPLSGSWWPELGPLTRPERAVVLGEVGKRRRVIAIEAFAYGRSIDEGGRIELREADLIEHGVHQANLLEAGWCADPDHEGVLTPTPAALPRIRAAAAERQRAVATPEAP